MKKKLSATIEEDAYELLARAAAAEGLNLSEMVERSVRSTCSDYLPHAIDVTLLDNGGCSVAVSLRGVTFHSRRAARRHEGVGVQATLRVEPPARIDVDRIAAALREWQEPASREARSGRPLRATVRGISLQLAGLPLRADSDPAFVRGVLQAAADAIAAAEVTTFSEIARRECPSCGEFMARLNVWSDPRDSPDREEREWTCDLGHKTAVTPDAPLQSPARSVMPPGAGDCERRDAAAAFAEIGAWQGESAAEFASSLTKARQRGGRRQVPNP